LAENTLASSRTSSTHCLPSSASRKPRKMEVYKDTPTVSFGREIHHRPDEKAKENGTVTQDIGVRISTI